jgi:dTDP-4-dehydrorhamnose 3,5-epimerase
MRFEPLPLEGAWIIELERNVDERGSFARTFCEQEFAEHGLPIHYPQCNLSTNRRTGTLRGMHANIHSKSESKLVRCVRGAIFDVIIDVRPDSPSHHQWAGVELTADNGRALFVPEGFAHGFLTLADETDVYYHMGAVFQPSAARGFRWDDPAFGVTWPQPPTVISERDATYPDFVPELLVD